MASKLFVGGLSFETANDQLRTFFEQAGAVQSASVVTDKHSGRSKGFGFVEMSNSAEARRAITELNGKTLGERPIRVEEANTPPRYDRADRRSGGSGSNSSRSNAGRRRW